QPGIDPIWRLLLITGFVGALTTFSTFSLETIQLLADGHAGSALANVATNLGGSLVLTYLGLLSGQAFWHATK
ncbi:MAG: CrcB family protein, partial [Burkholderiaceae bacterium]